MFYVSIWFACSAMSLLHWATLGLADIQLSVSISHRPTLKQNVSTDPTAPTCITEDGIDYDHVVMVPVHNLPHKTFEECSKYCLINKPDHHYLLISYEYHLFTMDKFSCLCAKQQGFANATVVQPQKCKNKCPSSYFECGDAGADLMSVYCTHLSCQGPTHHDSQLCAKHRPHENHGCINSDSIIWQFAHNVRNFSASEDLEADCIWACRDHYPLSMFALTRTMKGGAVPTCSCAYAFAFQTGDMVSNDFCDFLDQHADYYSVNCLSDLNDGHGNGNGSVRCHREGALGCMFHDLIPRAGQAWKVTVSAGSEQKLDVDQCFIACNLVSSGGATYAGVRFNATSNDLECECLPSASLNESMIGPGVACGRPCGSSGLECGDKGQGHAAVSLYCIPEKVQRSTTRHANQTKAEQTHLEEYLHAFAKNLHDTNVMNVLVIILLIVFNIFFLLLLIYLCRSRGPSSLSRQVM